ncbi:MAG: hypothetical protein ACREND_14155 [Gemmatimonadaceae bacterium]
MAAIRARRCRRTAANERREHYGRLSTPDVEQAQGSAIRVTPVGFPCADQLRTHIQAGREHRLRGIQLLSHGADVRGAHFNGWFGQDRGTQVTLPSRMVRRLTHRAHQFSEQIILHTLSIAPRNIGERHRCATEQYPFTSLF